MMASDGVLGRGFDVRCYGFDANLIRGTNRLGAVGGPLTPARLQYACIVLDLHI